MSDTSFEFKRKKPQPTLCLMFFSAELVVFWGRVCYLLQPHSSSSSAWPLACGNQLSPKHWQSVCRLPPPSTLPPSPSYPFSPWLQSITLQNSRTLFSLISICLRSINADILRSIYGEMAQRRPHNGLMSRWWVSRMQRGL